MIWPGVAIVLPAGVSFGGGSKGQTLRGMEVFVRRCREAATEWVTAVGGGGGGGGTAVVRLGVEEWMVGVVLWCVGGGVGDQEPGRRCFVYSWQPCCYQNRRSASRVRGTRARSFGSQSRAFKSHRTILFTAALPQSCRLHSSLFLASCHCCNTSTDGLRSSLLTRREF